MNVKDLILSKLDLKTQDVDVPEWGMIVTIRELCAAHADVIGALFAGGDARTPLERHQAFSDHLLVHSIVDPETKLPVFSEADLPALKGKSAKAVVKIVSAALELNGYAAMIPGAPDEGADPAKNSGAGPSAGSPSGSASPSESSTPTT